MSVLQDPNSPSLPATLEEAQNEIVVLRHQMAELRAQNRAMWGLLAEVSRRLQISSTSIKAAASSLLEHDIFWDSSNQHAFLEAIDDSVDEGARLITLMMLAFRSEANTLAMNLEPHNLSEILSAVVETLTAQWPQLHLDTTFPPSGKPALVDYEYLAIGLGLLLEALLESGMVSSQSTLRLTELNDCWRLDFLDTESSVIKALNHLCERRFGKLMSSDNISPENVLKLFTASRIIQLQNIKMEVQSDEASETALRLTIPVAFTT